MSDKLSDCPFCGGTNCTATSKGISKWYFIYCPDCLAEGPAENTPDQAIAAWNRRASPAPAIPAYPAKHISLKTRRDRKIVLTLELDAVEGAPAYLLTPVNPCVVRSAPAISESEDALLTAARRAIPALAHAAERNPAYQRDYEELSKAIDAARKGEKS
ncbi:Lar family restriction alleviation protein [Burkholderia gladioli]|uniref:Lar family restriction alleviation protein n=1 Tax=Burkholderia gladioli TaxID=28095 RepID=UPI003D1BAEA6